MRNVISQSNRPALYNMECFKVIKNNIEFLARKDNIKSILITSTKDDEGKTIVAVNLAAILAKEGNKTLIIDGNYTSPSEKDDNPAETCVNETAVKNLYRLCWEEYVDIQPYTQKLSEMVSSLKQSFDFIIIDSPSSARISDIQNLSQYADSCILVIKAGKTDVSEVAKLINQLTKLNVSIMGAILNENIDQDYIEEYAITSNTNNANLRTRRSRKGSGICFKRKFRNKTALNNT